MVGLHPEDYVKGERREKVYNAVPFNYPADDRGKDDIVNAAVYTVRQCDRQEETTIRPKRVLINRKVLGDTTQSM
jgi:hypothetical protein